jgi:hypothetical protein
MGAILIEYCMSLIHCEFVRINCYKVSVIKVREIIIYSYSSRLFESSNQYHRVIGRDSRSALVKIVALFSALLY